MQLQHGKNTTQQYIFGDFVLKNNGILLFKNKEYHIPPKELGVIILLLNADGEIVREGANKRGNSSRLTQSFHFFMFEPIFSPVNALNQPI